MVEITCGCAAYADLSITVPPPPHGCFDAGMAASPERTLSSLPCSPWLCVATREPFFRWYVILLQVAVGCLPMRDTIFCGPAQKTLGWCYEPVDRVQDRCSWAGGDRGWVSGPSPVWYAHSACERCGVFPVNRCREVYHARLRDLHIHIYNQPREK